MYEVSTLCIGEEILRESHKLYLLRFRQTHGAVSGKKTVTRGGRGKGGTQQAGRGAVIRKKLATATVSSKVQCSSDKGVWSC